MSSMTSIIKAGLSNSRVLIPKVTAVPTSAAATGTATATAPGATALVATAAATEAVSDAPPGSSAYVQTRPALQWTAHDAWTSFKKPQAGCEQHLLKNMPTPKMLMQALHVDPLLMLMSQLLGSSIKLTLQRPKRPKRDAGLHACLVEMVAHWKNAARGGVL